MWVPPWDVVGPSGMPQDPPGILWGPSGLLRAPPAILLSPEPFSLPEPSAPLTSPRAPLYSSRNPCAEQRATLGAQPVPYLLRAYALNYCTWRAEPGRAPAPSAAPQEPPRRCPPCPGWGATVSPRPFLVGSRGSLLFQQPSFWSCYLSKWIPARLKKQSCFFHFWLLFLR